LKKEVFLLPATVDPSRFPEKKDNFFLPHILCLFGTHNRDSIIDTIKSYIEYLKICNDIPWKLVLIGDFEMLKEKHEDGKHIESLILDNGLESHVIFSGVVGSSEIPSLLQTAACLITTPRAYESGGFPTKLAEYLLSGRPVITSNIGEIGNYLTDNQNAFFIDANNHLDVGRKIFYIQKNEAHAKNVALMGRKLALYKFNADFYIKDLLKYIYE
jgi:glycosyltransferase involved in cell wall biosynthesis